MQHQNYSLIGIYGGTFDPIHYGHLRIAEELSDQLCLSKILFVPSGAPRLRAAPVASRLHRAAMVRLAVQGNDRFLLDEREIKRPGDSTTIQTLREYRSQMGREVSLCCIVGMDAFMHINKWIEWRELFTLCHLIIAPRPGYSTVEEQNYASEIQLELNARLTGCVHELALKTNGLIYIATTSLLDISASRIRTLLVEEKSIRYLLPDSVNAYIHLNGLYRKDGIRKTD